MNRRGPKNGVKSSFGEDPRCNKLARDGGVFQPCAAGMARRKCDKLPVLAMRGAVVPRKTGYAQ